MKCRSFYNLAEATSLLRKSMVNAILPVGWHAFERDVGTEGGVAKQISDFLLEEPVPGPVGSRKQT